MTEEPKANAPGVKAPAARSSFLKRLVIYVVAFAIAYAVYYFVNRALYG